LVLAAVRTLDISTDALHSAVSGLSLHDALPIYDREVAVLRGNDLAPGNQRKSDIEPDVEDGRGKQSPQARAKQRHPPRQPKPEQDRKSTRLNSSHVKISYAVFCLKKNKRDSKTS